METAETLCQAIDGLAEVTELLQWAHLDGLTPLAPDPDRPTRVPPLPEPGMPKGGPDHVPGPRYDLGIGVHRSKVAYEAACRHLEAAGRGLTVNGKPVQAPRLIPARMSTAMVMCAWLARYLEHSAKARLSPAEQQQALKVCRLVFMAQDVLTAALNRGPASTASGALEKRCRVCRRTMEAKHAERNAICSLCRNVRRNDARKLKRKKQGKQARQRADVARQKVGDFTVAVDAQRRRRARGEDILEEFGCVKVVRDRQEWEA